MWHLACSSGKLEMVNYLHTNAERLGLDLHAITSRMKANVLHGSSEHIDTLSYLLSVSNSIGLDVNATCQYGTLLHIACSHNWTDVVKLILERSEKEFNLDFRKSFSTYNTARYSVFEKMFMKSYPNNMYYKVNVDVELLGCVL